MRARFLLSEGSPGGERALGHFDDPADALRARDDLYAVLGGRRRRYDVIDLERVDLGSPGIIDWCEACGEKRPAIWPGFDMDLCGVCRKEAEEDRREQERSAQIWKAGHEARND